MKKQITRFLLVFIGVFMLSFVNAQSVVTTSDESAKSKCDGSAMISSLAVPNITSWVWKKDSVQILQQGGKDLLNLCAGNYVLEYVDKQTKKHVETFVVKTKTVAPNPCDGFSVSVSKVQNNVKSPNGCSGLIELATKGGKAPFNFTWGNNPSKTNVADKLCAGTYNGYVKDSNNCMAQFSAVVGLDSTNTGGGTPNVCDGFKAIIKQTVNNTGKSPNCNGMLTAGVMGGKAPFTFTWVNANNFAGQTLQDLCGGMYYVTIKDSNNCTSSVSGNVVNQGDSTATGGGNTNPCEGFKVELVHAQNNKKGSPNCVGFIETKLLGGKAPFKFNWSNGGKDAFNQGLCKGLYTLTVTDSNNCTTSLPSVMIGEDSTTSTGGGTPDCSTFKVFVGKVQNNTSKDSICNGMIEVIAQGGKAPFSFNWVGTKGFGNVAQGLCAGQYYVTVKDSNNCSTSTFATVKKEGDTTTTGGGNNCANFAVKFAFIQNNISKDSICNGMLQAEGFGGKAPYSYEWSNSLGTAPSVKGLCEGNYYVTVKDANNCSLTISQFIKKETGTNGGGNGPCVNYNANVAAFHNNTDPTNCNGYISINVNGKAPFNFKWANMPNAFGPTIQGLCGGNYYVTVTDSNNCTTSLSQMINNEGTNGGGNPSNGKPCQAEIGGKQLDSTGLNFHLFDKSRVDSGNVVSYIWKIDSKQVSTLKEFDNVFSKGKHNVEFTIITSKGCEDTQRDTLDFPHFDNPNGGGTGGNPCANFNASIGSLHNNNSTDPTKCNGYAMINVVGGLPPFTYTWTNAQNVTGNTIQGICEGNFVVVAKDANNCVFTTQVFIKNEANNGGGTPNGKKCQANFKGTQLDATGLKYRLFDNSRVDSGYVVSYEWKIDNVLAGNAKDIERVFTKGIHSASLSIVTSNGCKDTYADSVEFPHFDNPAGGGNGGDTTKPNPCQFFKVEIVKAFNNKIGSPICVGVAEAKAFGGKEPFTYHWNNGSSTSVAEKLCAGKYLVYAKDSIGCVFTTSVEIFNDSVKGGGTGENPCDKFNVHVGNFKNNKPGTTACTGMIEAKTEGGKSPFMFSWNNGQTASVAQGLCAGTYTVNVKDSMGCYATLTQVVKNDSVVNNGGTTGGGVPNCFADLKFSFDPANKQKVNFNITSTIANAYYIWYVDGNQVNNQGDKYSAILTPGFHKVYVNVNGACAFTASASFDVMNNKPCEAHIKVNPLDSTGLKFHFQDDSRIEEGTIVSYNWKFDGKVEDTTFGFDRSFTVGKHSVEYSIVTSTGCKSTMKDSTTFPHFDQPQGPNPCDSFRVELVKVENNKQGSANCTGFIETKVISGKAPFNFMWDNMTVAGATNKLANICGGKHHLEVKDANGCRAELTQELFIDTLKTTGINPCKDFKVELTKFINDKANDTIGTGMIDVHAVAGAAPFFFKWNNGVNTPFNEKLKAGTYTVNVKDANNCYATLTQTIFQDSVIVSNPCLGFKVELARVQNTRKGETICTGLAEVRTYGGTAPYMYKWSNGANSNVIEKLCEGKYTLIVKDKNNCSTEFTAVIKGDSVVNPTTVNNCAGFIININSVKNTVKGAANCTGAIMANAIGGKQPYNFYWSNGSKDLFLFNVCAATYTLKAVDANGCLVSITKEIKEDSVINTNNCTTLTANVLVKNTEATNSKCNGALGASVSGGTAPYTYEWSNGKKSQHIDSLCEGNFSVTITDAKKCAVKVEKYVGRDSLVQNPCAGFFANVQVRNDQDGDTICTGALLANAGGGKLPYIYKWSNGSTEPYLKGACQGSYAVSIFDGNNCSVTIEKTVGLDTVYNPCKYFYAKIAGVEHSGLNAAKCNGSLKVAVAGGKAPYDFTWSNGGKAPSITDLCPDEYTVEVKDANKCSIVLTGKVFIDSTKNLCDGFFTKVVEVKNDKAGDNKCTGEIITATIGGKLPYTYQWSTGAQTKDIKDVCADNYSLYVKDANNCINQLDKVIGSDSIVDPCKGFYGYISDVDDYNADDTTCLGKLSATVKGGKLPFNYSWSNGDTTLTASNLCEGGYSLTIVDANQCNITLNGKVRMLPSKKQKLKAFVTSTDVTAAGACDGTVNVTVESGNAPYYFYHSNGEVSDSRTGVCAGVYSVIVKDSKNEVVELSYLISSPLNTITNTDVNVPVGADSTVVDTVAASVTKDCSIDYNAIDSVQIMEYKMISKDSLLVTWAVYSAANVTYVTDMYVFTAGSGVYSVNLELYCDEAKEIGNFLKASESFYYAAEGQTSIVEKVKENVNVYPNPFNDKFTVKLDKVQDYQIQVIDMSGKELYSNSYANTNAINMDLGHLATGQYILKIVSETSSFTRMIAK